jgi:hypothetical protein
MSPNITISKVVIQNRLYAPISIQFEAPLTKEGTKALNHKMMGGGVAILRVKMHFDDDDEEEEEEEEAEGRTGTIHNAN